jgi:hypothetical protein
MNFKFILPLAGSMLVSSLAFAQSVSSATQSLSATTTIWQPLRITNARDLAFGDIFSDVSAGTVTVDPATGTTTQTGGATVSLLPGHASPLSGQITITGQKNKAFTLVLPNDNVAKLTDGNTADDMGLTAFTPFSTTSTSNLGPGGSTIINIGAMLTLKPSQPQGAYSTNFPVTVTY